MKYNIYSFLLILLSLSACTERSSKSETENTTVHPEDEAHAHGDEVVVTAAQIEMAGIQLGTVVQKNLSSSLAVNGTLAVPNQNKAFVTTMGSGMVRALRVHPGDYVRKGQVLATITNATVADLQQQLINVEAQLGFAVQEVNRLQTLVKGNAAPLKSLQKAESEVRGLTAQKTALRQQLAALGAPFNGQVSALIQITAPISGNITDVYAEIGSQVDGSTPIAQITNNGELHLDLFVFEKDLSKIEVGQTIHFTLTNNPGKEFDAKIYAIGSAFTNQAKAIPVHAHVINDKQGLIEGMSVTARVSIGSGLFFAVPDEAIISNDGKDYVFVLEPAESTEAEKHFQRVQVFRGTSDIGYTEIKPVKPLEEGTQIATKGAFFLMAMLTNEGDHDH